MLMSEVNRPEEGPMVFENDWTGIFIRGDGALMYYLPALEDLLKNGDKADFINRIAVQSLIDLLSRAQENPDAGGLQRLKPFVQCLRK
jgi:hypothetical protein